MTASGSCLIKVLELHLFGPLIVKLIVFLALSRDYLPRLSSDCEEIRGTFLVGRMGVIYSFEFGSRSSKVTFFCLACFLSLDFDLDKPLGLPRTGKCFCFKEAPTFTLLLLLI